MPTAAANEFLWPPISCGSMKLHLTPNIIPIKHAELYKVIRPKKIILLFLISHLLWKRLGRSAFFFFFFFSMSPAKILLSCFPFWKIITSMSITDDSSTRSEIIKVMNSRTKNFKAIGN